MDFSWTMLFDWVEGMLMGSVAPELDPYMEFLAAVIVILLFVTIGFVVNKAIKKFAPYLFSKTKTTLDDLLVHAIRKPIFVGFFLLGTYLSLPGLSVLQAFGLGINTIYSLLIIIFFGWTAVEIIDAIIEWYLTEVAIKTKSKKDDQFVPIIRKALYGVVGLAAFLWILSQLGVEPTAMITALGVGGLALALGLQDTLKEFFAGTYLIADRPIRIGDVVELEGGDKGTVIDIGLRSTRIKSFSGNLVILPNSKVASNKIINYELPDEHVVFNVDCGVGYGEDLERVEKVAIKVAEKVMKDAGTGIEDFQIFVRFQEFGDSNINFKTFFSVHKYSDQFLVKHNFIKALKKEFDRQKIEISWPVVKVVNAKKR